MCHFAQILADVGESALFTMLSNVFSDEQIIKLSQVEDNPTSGTSGKMYGLRKALLLSSQQAILDVDNLVVSGYRGLCHNFVEKTSPNLRKQVLIPSMAISHS